MFVTDMEHDLFIVYRLFYLLCLDFKNLEEKIIKIIYDYEYFRIIDTDIVECFKYTESVIFFFFFWMQILFRVVPKAAWFWSMAVEQTDNILEFTVSNIETRRFGCSSASFRETYLTGKFIQPTPVGLRVALLDVRVVETATGASNFPERSETVHWWWRRRWRRTLRRCCWGRCRKWKCLRRASSRNWKTRNGKIRNRRTRNRKIRNWRTQVIYLGPS